MGVIRFKKVIANLPAQLEPDTVYAVRTGAGFDLYISDATGSVAHALNLSSQSSGGVWHVLNHVNTNTRYIPYANSSTALTTLGLTANRIYYIPFVPPIDITITSLAVEVTTASAGTGQIGIYNTANFRPSKLIAGSVVNINTGTTGVKSDTVNITLMAGNLYWLALINTSAATIRAVAVAGVQTLMGIATGGTAWNTHYFQAGSNGVLPATAGTLSSGTGALPAIYVTYDLGG